MRTRRNLRRKEIFDAFYCTIDGWSREYHFRIRYPETRRNCNGRSFDEWDRVEIVGTVRHHSTSRTTRRQRFKTMQCWLFPNHKARNEREKDPKDIGNIMQASGGMLRVMVELPAGAYYSIIPSLSAGHFKQVRVHIRNMRFSRGSIDGIEFDPVETRYEDLG